MAIDSDVLTAATLRVDRDEAAAAANGDEVGTNWDICCCWRYSGEAEEDDGNLAEEAREDKD